MMSKESLKIVAIVEAQPAHSDTLLGEFKTLVAKSREEAGNIRYDLHQSVENPNVLVFEEHWRDQAAVDAHNGSAHFQKFLKAIEGTTDKVQVVVMKDVTDNQN